MSSINLKIDEERNVIQSYYNGKWNDLSNRNIDTKLYPIILSDWGGHSLTMEKAFNAYKDAEGNFKWNKKKHHGYEQQWPVNPYNGILWNGYNIEWKAIIIPTDTLRTIPNVPVEVFNQGVVCSKRVPLRYTELPSNTLSMISLFGSLPNSTSYEVMMHALTLPSNMQTEFPDYNWHGEITVILIEGD